MLLVGLLWIIVCTMTELQNDPEQNLSPWESQNGS